MPSSISSSDLMQPGKPGDDPRVAEGPVLRPLPERPLGRAALIAVLVAFVALAAWEMHWRDFGARPGSRNSDGQWAVQRRRIDEGEGGNTVLLGASRVLFDIDLDAWERVTGERPIQLAVEGTTPLPMLEDLAADPDFTGRVLVGVAPDVFFSGFAYRGKILAHYHKETPSQRASEWLSANTLEPWLAFWGDPDFALFTVLKRQAWPARPGVPNLLDVRKLSMTRPDRDTEMWNKLVDDPEYRELARRIWAQYFDFMPRTEKTEAVYARMIEAEIEKAVRAVATLRARGVPVVFVRPPSDGAYYAFEQRDFPRAGSWDALLARSGAPGIHFEDHPAQQGLSLPEWSHLAASERARYTESVLAVIEAGGMWGLPAAAP